MTNVPTSSQTRPPGLAITSAQQAPGECLRVSVAGKELFSATFQTGWRSVGAGSSFRAAGGGPAASPRPRGPQAAQPRVGCPFHARCFPELCSLPDGTRRAPRIPATAGRAAQKPRGAAGMRGCSPAAKRWQQPPGQTVLPRLFWLISHLFQHLG